MVSQGIVANNKMMIVAALNFAELSWISPVVSWFHEHPAAAAWVFAVSVAFLVLGTLAVPILIVRMPADYFTRAVPASTDWRVRHRAVHLALQVLKNACGLVFFVLGIVM